MKNRRPFAFCNNRKVEGTKLSQNAKQKCPRSWRQYRINYKFHVSVRLLKIKISQ